MISTADRNRIVAQLKLFGCNPREAAIYMQCLELGPSSVQTIAKKLTQNRVTVHHSVDQLLQKGLLFETRKGRKRLIVAEEPVGLLRLLKRKENEFELMKANADHVIQLLSSLQSIDHSVPIVKCYEGVEGFKRMLDETLSTTNEVLVYSNVDLFSRLIGAQYLEQYFRRRSKKSIRTRLIFPRCTFGERVNAKSKEYKIEVRFLPQNFAWKSGIFSWNDCLALMSYTEQKLTCTIIENKDIAAFYRSGIFEFIWKQASALRT